MPYQYVGSIYVSCLLYELQKWYVKWWPKVSGHFPELVCLQSMVSFPTVAIYIRFEFESLVCPTFTAVTKAHLYELVSVYLNILDIVTVWTLLYFSNSMLY